MAEWDKAFITEDTEGAAGNTRRGFAVNLPQSISSGHLFFNFKKKRECADEAAE